MKKILITGGAGFIGSALALALKQKGYEVTLMDNLSPQIHGLNPEKTSPLYKRIINEGFRFIKGSVVNKGDWLKAIEGQDVIIHYAAETGTGQSMYQIHKYTEVNISGTSIMLDILLNRHHSIQKVIVASSRAIYGEGKYQCLNDGIVFPTSRKDFDMQNGEYDCKCPICNRTVSVLATSEDSMIHPSSIYGITKQTQEQLIHTACSSVGISSIAFRYQNVYGPGQSLTNPYTGIISIFTQLLKTNQTIRIFEDGLESRDFVYIDDAVKATILGLESNSNNNVSYNVGSGKLTTVKQVVVELLKNIPSSSRCLITNEYRLGDIRHNYADLSKIKNELGYIPKYSFQEGVKRFCQWSLKNGLNYIPYLQSLKELEDRNLIKKPDEISKK